MDENQLRQFLLNSISEYYNNLLAGYERQIMYQGNPTLYSERNKVVTTFNQQIEYLQVDLAEIYFLTTLLECSIIFKKSIT